MKNLTSLAILLAAVIGFMPAKPAQANPYYYGHTNYVTRYYVHRPVYRHVYRYRYYYPKTYSTYRVYYYR